MNLNDRFKRGVKEKNTLEALKEMKDELQRECEISSKELWNIKQICENSDSIDEILKYTFKYKENETYRDIILMEGKKLLKYVEDNSDGKQELRRYIADVEQYEEELNSNIRKYNQYVSSIEDVRVFIEKFGVRWKVQKPFFTLKYDKYKMPVFLLCNLEKSKMYNKDYFNICGFYGGYSLKLERRQCIRASLKLIEEYDGCYYMKLQYIDVGEVKRLGRGKITLKYIEELVPCINEIIREILGERWNKYNKICGVRGESNDISVDTCEGARRRFYMLNGYKFKKGTNRFYKTIKEKP